MLGPFMLKEMWETVNHLRCFFRNLQIALMATKIHIYINAYKLFRCIVKLCNKKGQSWVELICSNIGRNVCALIFSVVERFIATRWAQVYEKHGSHYPKLLALACIASVSTILSVFNVIFFSVFPTCPTIQGNKELYFLSAACPAVCGIRWDPSPSHQCSGRRYTMTSKNYRLIASFAIGRFLRTLWKGQSTCV